jgi:hypothetical protein
MRRRDLITLVAASGTLLLVTNFARSAEKVWRIGYLSIIGPPRQAAAVRFAV